MITEHDIAALCLAIYPGQPPVEWDLLELPAEWQSHSDVRILARLPR